MIREAYNRCNILWDNQGRVLVGAAVLRWPLCRRRLGFFCGGFVPDLFLSCSWLFSLGWHCVAANLLAGCLLFWFFDGLFSFIFVFVWFCFVLFWEDEDLWCFVLTCGLVEIFESGLSGLGFGFSGSVHLCDVLLDTIPRSGFNKTLFRLMLLERVRYVDARC